VVLIGSRVARGMAGRSQYAATKAALVALARSWAAETVVTQGVTVNVVSPAATQPAMLATRRARARPRVPPLGRLIQPRGSRCAGGLPALARRRGHHGAGDPDLRRHVAGAMKAWDSSALSASAWSARRWRSACWPRDLQCTGFDLRPEEARAALDALGGKRCGSWRSAGHPLRCVLLAVFDTKDVLKPCWGSWGRCCEPPTAECRR
jgi:hypothetical protein